MADSDFLVSETEGDVCSSSIVSGGGFTLLSPNSTTTGTGRNDPEKRLLSTRARAVINLREIFNP